MKILFVDKAGDGGLDIAMRATAAGHECRYFLQSYDRDKRPIGRGLVERIPDWRPSLRWADLILLMQNDYGVFEMDRARQAIPGLKVIGGSCESARWENDRLHGMRVFRKAGIEIPPVREFTDYDAAIAHVKREDRPFASKPCWDGADKALSYVGKSPEDLVFMLTRWKRRFGRPKGPFILQDKISGIEFAVGAWFGPDGFAPGWEENFEHKSLFPDDRGPNTGEMGTVMRYVARSKLADKVLAPLESELKRIRYTGNIDVNCIVDEAGTPWPLEFTMRFGWPAYNIEQRLFGCDPMEFLAGLAEGRPPARAHRMNEVAVGVVLALPPFPHPITDYASIIGVPLYGAQGGEEWLHPAEMMQGAPAGSEESCLLSAGDYVAVVTGVGDTVRGASARAYRAIEQLSMPASPFWRDDIGRKLRRCLDPLQAHGYAAGLSYA